MSEYIAVAPPGQVKLGAGGKEVKAGLRQFHPALPQQHLVECRLQTMQKRNVICGIGLLLLRQSLGAPI